MMLNLNQHLSKTALTETEHYNRHVVEFNAELLY